MAFGSVIFNCSSKINEFLESLAPVKKQNKKSVKLEKLKMDWKKHLFETPRGNGDHHDASNQIGRMIMREGLNLPQCTKLTSINLHQKAASLFIQFLFVDSILHYKYTGLEETEIVLVDDRGHEGYDTLIKEMLSLKHIKCLSGVFSDKNNFKLINDVLGMAVDVEKPQLFDGGDLLLLDLRLWTKEDENTVLNQYKPLAYELDPITFFGLCNVGKEEQKIKINVKFDTFMESNSHKRLALMPLIINKLDPSLPIILFSSTQHRSVYQAVRDCPAIITNFAKPYIGGYDRDEYEPETVLNGLYMALDKAKPMIKVREVWKYAVKQWKDIPIINDTNDNNIEITWSTGWPPEKKFLANNCPWKWLRDTWLPLAQQGEYAFAAAEPWCYLVKLLGNTRIEILEKETQDETIATCIKIIKDAQYVPMLFLDKNKDKDKNKDRNNDEYKLIIDIAITSALALIVLIHEWTKKSQGDSHD